MSNIVKFEKIEEKLLNINEKPVLLAKDVADLYNVSVSALNQAVKRREDLFPIDFRFQLTDLETKNLKSQGVISSDTHGGSRKNPYVYTEEGLYMLATVLKSDRAKLVHFNIVKTFSKIRQISKNLRKMVSIDGKEKQNELISRSNHLLNEVIEADIIEKKKLDSNIKKVKDEFEINLGVIKFKRTIENKDS